MENQSQQPLPQATPPFRWRRDVIAGHLESRSLSEAHMSEPVRRCDAFAQTADVPRSTLRYCQKRKDHIMDHPQVKAFFESPVGVAVLHVILTAVQFTTPLRGGCGVPLVCEFLALTRLSLYVPPSLSAQQRVNSNMEDLTGEFGDTQQQHLAPIMPARELTVAEDETFHPSICLVAIAVVFNFILLERYAPRRDEATWDLAIWTALKGLPVKIIQTVGDQAKALVSHTVLTLKAVHSPDIFHILHELFKATALCMFSRIRAAETDVEQAAAQVVDRQTRLEQTQLDNKRQQDLPKLKAFLARAIELKAEASNALAQLKSWQQQLRDSIKAISEAYHPFSLADGTLQTPEQVQARLDVLFDRIRQLAHDAQLPQRSLDGIEKAYRVVPEMIETLRFVHSTLTTRLQALALPEELATLVRAHLIPALYLQLTAKKAKGADKRKTIADLASRLMAELNAPESPFMRLDVVRRDTLYEFARGCAQLFQRSSSCVEGRNGHLSLFHHGLHRLSEKRLRALTVIHNYYITDPEGHAPAEGFFGQPHDSLFEFLLERMPLPHPTGVQALSSNRRTASLTTGPVGISRPIPSTGPQDRCARHL